MDSCNSPDSLTASDPHMADIQNNYHRFLLIAAAILAVIVSVMLIISVPEARKKCLVPGEPAAKAAFAADPSVAALRADRQALKDRRPWGESKASPFVSRTYLLRDDRLVDILESGSNLFDGIPTSWILANKLDYLDRMLPERDPDGDGFTNLEEFSAKTNPQDKASTPPEATKLRLVGVERKNLELILAEPFLVQLTRPKTLVAQDATKSITLEAATTYENPTTDAASPLQNPPSFEGKTLQVQFGPDANSEAKVVDHKLDHQDKGTLELKLALPPSAEVSASIAQGEKMALLNEAKWLAQLAPQLAEAAKSVKVRSEAAQLMAEISSPGKPSRNEPKKPAEAGPRQTWQEQLAGLKSALSPMSPSACLLLVQSAQNKSAQLKPTLPEDAEKLLEAAGDAAKELKVAPESAGSVADKLLLEMQDAFRAEALTPAKLGWRIVAGAMINSQRADDPGQAKGTTARYLVGQQLYSREAKGGGLAAQNAVGTPYRLVSITTEQEAAPELGKNQTKPILCAGIESSDGKKTKLQQGRPQVSPTAVATFRDSRKGDQPFTVNIGDEFEFGGVSYKLIDASAEKATITDPSSGASYDVPKEMQVEPPVTPAPDTTP